MSSARLFVRIARTLFFSFRLNFGLDNFSDIASRSNLVELAAIAYWLSVGLSFELARETLKTLKEREPEFFSPSQRVRLMLYRHPTEQSFLLNSCSPQDVGLGKLSDCGGQI